jgi:hypothetical protein
MTTKQHSITTQNTLIFKVQEPQTSQETSKQVSMNSVLQISYKMSLVAAPRLDLVT